MQNGIEKYGSAFFCEKERGNRKCLYFHLQLRNPLFFDKILHRLLDILYIISYYKTKHR